MSLRICIKSVQIQRTLLQFIVQTGKSPIEKSKSRKEAKETIIKLIVNKEDMEEMMMINKHENSSDESSTSINSSSWKLYENPLYNAGHHHHHYQQQQECTIYKQFLREQIPAAACKVTDSISELKFLNLFMDTKLKMAQAQIMKLKAELEYERKARKKLEHANLKLAREMAEERSAREALERVCEELAKGISSEKAEISRLKRDLEEEKKMLRMAEVLREESVQMKLSEANIFLEQRLTELEGSEKMHINNVKPEKSHNDFYFIGCKQSTGNDKNFFVSGELSGPVLSENYGNSVALRKLEVARSMKPASNDNNGNNYWMVNQRKTSPEPENPHIKRGIKGFVEFPRVVRAVGSKGKRWGNKLECQKAQLRTLLKQKCLIKSNNLIMS